MHVFRHPKYYEEFRQRAKRYQKELRERNKEEARAQLKVPSSNLDQAISKRQPTGESERASWSGPKAPSSKQQASSTKPQAPSKSKTLEQDS